MDAHPYLDKSGNWMVSLRLLGKEVDEAGPFDDEVDAVMAAERSVYGDGVVVMGSQPHVVEHPHVELEAA